VVGHGQEVILQEFKKDPWNRRPDTAEFVIKFFQIKCTSLLTKLNQTYTSGRAWAKSDTSGVSEISVK